MLFARALLSFALLPGLVAGVIPPWLASADRMKGARWMPGYFVLGCGLCLLVWCVRDFYVSGRGTLAPWDPPRHLVIVGLYRFTRNPMYLGVLTVVAGWALAESSPVLWRYLLFLAVAFHLRVMLFEEPWLERQFGPQWSAYSAGVRRWWPRVSPWRFPSA